MHIHTYIHTYVHTYVRTYINTYLRHAALAIESVEHITCEDTNDIWTHSSITRIVDHFSSIFVCAKINKAIMLNIIDDWINKVDLPHILQAIQIM